MSTNQKKKRSKRHLVRPYFVTPIVYVLIALIAVVPAALALLSFTVSTVHKALPAYGITAYDFRLDDSAYTPSDANIGTVTLPHIKYGDKIGELTVKSAGIDTAVYYGRNIISCKEGAGLKSGEKLPGQNGTAEISADISGAFKSLKNVKVGDEIRLNTSWGRYVYTVSAVSVSEEAPEASMPQTLLLYTADSNKAFSTFNETKLYVMADCKSGPQAEEVQS